MIRAPIRVVSSSGSGSLSSVVPGRTLVKIMNDLDASAAWSATEPRLDV